VVALSLFADLSVEKALEDEKQNPEFLSTD
jgi:hypothetical protein